MAGPAFSARAGAQRGSLRAVRRAVTSARAGSGRASGFSRGDGQLQAQCCAATRRAHSAGQRLDVRAVIPQTSGEAREQAPPDLPSFLFKERIIYLGMSLVPSVTELILAELLYLQYEDANKPVYFYINSTGVTKGGKKLGYETEAFAIYDTMQHVKTPIHTVAVGTAWGEAAMLLAAGEPGQRAALPSATIMLRQPVNLFRGQASDLEIQRKETRQTKGQIFGILSRHTGKKVDELQADITRPRYFDPQGAIDYGLIDKVLDPNAVQGMNAF
mmetsp:Transcript_13033/g.42978  ORF Transcript_13033/g.42978 Transcript_13033/m.42978 type:complete len:273 (+) Transcript_13033:12-830(+)